MGFRCHLCEYSCGNLKEYWLHTSKHPEFKGCIKFPAKSCNKILQSCPRFYSHISSNHAGLKRDSSSKDLTDPLICDHCKNDFKTLSEIELHFRTSVLRKNVTIACPLCEKSGLPSFDAYKKHKKRHNKERVKSSARHYEEICKVQVDVDTTHLDVIDIPPENVIECDIYDDQDLVRTLGSKLLYCRGHFGVPASAIDFLIKSFKDGCVAS